ncbi:MAG: hypothetical protein ACOYKZ_01130 [Chlamydiia bacterium]
MQIQRVAKWLAIVSIPLCIGIGVATIPWWNTGSSTYRAAGSREMVTIAILAKDKAHTLPTYLECIEHQTWPKSQTYLYIRTNNNNDATAEILRTWVDRVHGQYPEIYFNDARVDLPVEKYGPHEWNTMRFQVLGQIRKDSLEWARQHKSNYFVADCDNFILPETLETLAATQLPMVAPLLRCHRNGPYCPTAYSNYHAAVDQQGYYRDDPLYYSIWRQDVKGLIEVPVIHCTYFLRHDVLDKLSYDDGSGLHEYVIFSASARKQHIPQYLDNRKVYGYITFADKAEDFKVEPWLAEIRKATQGTKKVSSIAQR